jgi:hypothetical protein
MVSLFIEIKMAQLILRTILSNVVTVLPCTACSVQAANVIFMVSLLMYFTTRKHIALILCVYGSCVQNCWTIFDEHFYEYYAMRSDSILVLLNCLLVRWCPATWAG